MQVELYAGRQQQKRGGLEQQKKEKGRTTLGMADQTCSVRKQQVSN